MLPVMQVGRVRPGAPPEHDVLHPVGGGLGQARPTNNIGIHGIQARCLCESSMASAALPGRAVHAASTPEMGAALRKCDGVSRCEDWQITHDGLRLGKKSARFGMQA